jgi:putative membrane protein
MSVRVIDRWLAAAAIAAALLGTNAAKAEEDVAETSQSLISMSIADISGVLVAANNGEIEQAEIALARSLNPAVRAYAERMIRDHSQANREVQIAASRLRATPTGNDVSCLLEQQNLIQTAVLLQLVGPVFDAVYMDAQILAHQQVLSLIGGQIVPAAVFPGFQSLLGRSQALVSRHLQLAQSIWASL